MFHAAAMRAAAMVLSGATARVRTSHREVFLTFDDGPHPEATPWVLDQLARHSAKATFFCLGKQAAQHPGLIARIKEEGHAIGHHTWDHPSGWTTDNVDYIANVMRGHATIGGDLFRPPYGRIGPVQARLVSERFSIVLWDVLAGDYKPKANGNEVADSVSRRVRSGSIIVFHDVLKSFACLRTALPRVLKDLPAKGFIFPPLTRGLMARRWS